MNTQPWLPAWSSTPYTAGVGARACPHSVLERVAANGITFVNTTDRQLLFDPRGWLGSAATGPLICLTPSVAGIGQAIDAIHLSTIELPVGEQVNND